MRLAQGNRVNAPLLNAVHPPFVMPGLDPGISTDTAMARAREHGLRVLPDGFLRDYRRLLGIAAGRRSIPRCLAPP